MWYRQSVIVECLALKEACSTEKCSESSESVRNGVISTLLERDLSRVATSSSQLEREKLKKLICACFSMHTSVSHRERTTPHLPGTNRTNGRTLVVDALRYILPRAITSLERRHVGEELITSLSHHHPSVPKCVSQSFKPATLLARLTHKDTHVRSFFSKTSIKTLHLSTSLNAERAGLIPPIPRRENENFGRLKIRSEMISQSSPQQAHNAMLDVNNLLQ